VKQNGPRTGEQPGTAVNQKDIDQQQQRDDNMIWIGVQSEKLVERVEVHPSHGPVVGGKEKNQSLNQCPSSAAPIIVEVHGVIVVEAAVQSWEDEVAKVQQHNEHAERGNQVGLEQK
jgi:hypothetical protein